MTPKILPSIEELLPGIILEVYQNGGHVGFISGNIFNPIYWLEKRVVDFFKS